MNPSQLTSLRAFTLGLLASVLPWACSDNAGFKGNTRGIIQDSSDSQGKTFSSSNPLNPQEGTLPRSVSRIPDAISALFPGAVIKQDSFRFTLDPKGVQTDFLLTDIQQAFAESKDQLTRTPRTQTFKQGTAGMAVTQTIPQTAKKGLVDILVVVDDSGSMKEEQNNLGTKLNELLVSLGNTQWQIGVISTSPVIENNVTKCVMSLIKYTDVDAMDRFKMAVNVGISGNANEQGIRQAVVGLGCQTTPLVRPNSTVAVLIVSDEDNCSKDGQDCGSELWAKESYLINYVEGTLNRTVGVNAGFYGIFSPPATPCNTAGNIGTQYQRLVDYKANGAKNYGNICDSSYKTTLNRISDSIALLLSNQFELNEIPSPGTLSLKLKLADGSEQAVAPGDYTLQGKTITFLAGKEPPIGSTILAAYRVGVVPTFKSVVLADVPAAGTLAVRVNGAALSAGSYTLVDKTITFNTQPADLADISVDYRLNTALNDRFRLTQVPLNNTLVVTVDGNASNSYSFDAVNNQVVFNPVPGDGARIAFAYRFRVGPQLSYTIPLMAGAFNVKILDGTKALVFQQANDVFTISAADHVNGKTLKLQYEVPDGMPRNFSLSHAPIPGSAAVQTSGTCNLGKGLDIQGNMLMTSCSVTSSTIFILDYKYHEVQKRFQLMGVPDPEKGTWSVLVNGVAISDFVREGNSITLNFEPELDAKIAINYSFPES